MILNVFGPNRRTAVPWDARLANPVLTVFGETDLDFRLATLGEGETEVVIAAMFGEVEVTVPEGLPVLVTGMTVLGRRQVFDESTDGLVHGTDHASDGFLETGGRRLRLVIFNMLGEVHVRQTAAVGASVGI